MSALIGTKTVLPTVSVVIAAHTMKRWAYLKAAVASVQAQTVPAAETVVAVDHNPQLCERALQEFAGITVVPNIGQPGASATRNTGVRASHGEVVAFLDDDAIASPAWLETLLMHFSRPEVVGVGGGLVARWETRRPRWFPPEFDWVVGASYRGMAENAEPTRNVWSNNMAIRRRTHDDIGGFREDFGKIADRSHSEDTDLCLRAAAHDGGIWIYEPLGLAAHHVPAKRATLRFFLKRCFSEGQGKAALAAFYGLHQSTSTERGYIARVLSPGIARSMRDALHGDASGAFRGLAMAAGLVMTAAGFLAGRSPQPSRLRKRLR
ncbi:MAG: glycosyl transferase [Chloroflexi bacterium]|nr:MAG: glycosyl transferase [Chloroflexota bacterium]